MRTASNFFNSLLSVFIEVLCVVLMFCLLWQFLPIGLVSDEAMNPTLATSQLYVGLGKGTVYFTGIERGNIVIIQNGDTKSIRRLVGLPGDEVSIEYEQVYINGVLLDEPYVRSSPSKKDPTAPHSKSYSLAENQYLVLNDNRYDGTTFSIAPICSREQIVGVVPVRFQALLGILLCSIIILIIMIGDGIKKVIMHWLSKADSTEEVVCDDEEYEDEDDEECEDGEECEDDEVSAAT